MPGVRFHKLKYDGEIGNIVKNELIGEFSNGYILVGNEETCFPESYALYAEKIRTFEVRNSDTFVISFPKAGTTWTQEMVWLIANDCNFEGANNDLQKRFPFLESCTLQDNELIQKIYKDEKFQECSIDYTNKLDSPRFIKTHLPFALLPDDIQYGNKCPKIIYVVRNPKDICVSFYHHGLLLEGWHTNLENFAKVFLADKVMYGSFWKHTLGYWKQKSNPNILFLKYEDMKKDLRSVIKKVANFLEKKITEENIKRLCEHLSFESMQTNKNVNYNHYIDFRKKHNLTTTGGNFMRAGVVGKFKEEMSPETIKKFDNWIKENTAGTSFLEYHQYS